MRRITTCGGRWWMVAGLLVAVFARPVAALYLDEDQNISLRARIYSQGSIRAQDSRQDTVPQTFAGQLVQDRNFYNPELDAKLTSYTDWMKNPGWRWLAPDEFSFRVAGWGFYDGVYDYGSGQFNTSQRMINSSYPNLSNPRTHAFFLEGNTFNPKGNTLDTIIPGNEALNPRDIFGHQQRINELYLSYTKGPVFVRFGRQAISWGESDTIGILDQNNPFDLTQAAPGIFEDIDEARIPLWTLRTSLNLFDTLGPLSSGFVETYWVPGQIDANTGWSPAILGASPYSARGQDPQTLTTPLQNVLPTQVVLLDNVPKREFNNSRYGIRLQTVVNRAFTVSAWMYTHFPSQPPPLAHGLTKTNTFVSTIAGNQPVELFTTETFHKLTNVYGLSNTFFFEPFNGIIRMEAEYFDHEPGFVPEQNLGVKKNGSALSVLNACTPNPKTGVSPCSIAYQNVLRWEMGYDRFFFVRPLNPTNSFLLSIAQVGAWSITEQETDKDFGFAGQRKPGTQGTSPSDYVPQKVVEAFAQAHLETDYMHGRMTPAITYIQNVRGTWAVLPSITYRWTDWLLFSLQGVAIGGEYESFGFFNDRSQVSLRATYQLN